MLSGQTIGMSDALLIAVVGMVIVIAILAIIALFILLLSKIFTFVDDKASKKKKASKEVVENTSNPPTSTVTSVTTVPSGEPLPATQSQGELKLTNVDESTAAVIMAIVSNRSGVPLNRLLFKSIKLIEEK